MLRVVRGSLVVFFAAQFLRVTPAFAQMQMGPPQNFTQEIEAHTTSGTSAQPDSTPAPMLMTMRGEWMLMLHGNGFIADTQQTSPRGGDKLFSTNWVMPMAQRSWGPGELTLRTMLSLEPATVTGRQYPLLFQQGETAYGLPIADGQHPHDFVMEFAALYDLHLGDKVLLSFYARAGWRSGHWPHGLSASRIRHRESGGHAGPSSGGLDPHL